jgi:GT2 family glycosyltransferase
VSSQKDSPLVSVIILNWNGADYLGRCVASVLETDYPTNLLEVIVVDNGSTDNSAKSVKKMYPKVKLVENRRNLGFCIGNNIGIKIASGDLIILLNNDTIVDKAWIKNLIQQARDPKVGVIGCKLFFPRTKVIQAVGFRMKFTGYIEIIGSGEIDHGQFNTTIDLDYVSGAALAIKKEVLTKIGLLDPRFYAYGEDADLCYRARKAGYLVTCSKAVVYHYGSISWNRFPIRKLYLNIRNNLRLIRKHYPPRSLLGYMLLPPKLLKVDCVRFLRRQTILQRAELTTKSTRKQSAFKLAIETILLETMLFFVTLLMETVSEIRRASDYSASNCQTDPPINESSTELVISRLL